MLDENLLVDDEETTDEEYFYVHDGLGTVRQIVDASHNIENSYDFEGFGTEISTSENIYKRNIHKSTYKKRFQVSIMLISLKPFSIFLLMDAGDV